MKLWGGRFTQNTDSLVDEYTSSIGFDQRLAQVDIRGSIAHATMLGQQGVISQEAANQLVGGLTHLLQDVQAGEVKFRVEDEDIHMNVERLLHERVGSVAGQLHTARSRNDQVALDMHMYIRDVLSELAQKIRAFQVVLVDSAERHLDVVIPGYTHLQRAQPVLLSHHLLAYFWMLERDLGRFRDVQKRANMMPLGAGALAGTTFPINREQVMRSLSFDCLYENSLDAVSDRDYLLEFLSASSIVMMHLSRLAEELVLWTSEEFGFVELADAYCTGSSMMPQKKNPDVAELVRGKTGRVYGHLLALLTVLKGLPLAYNKDLQEDKEGVFDTIDTLWPALTLFTGMVQTMRVRTERLETLFARDFSNATDVADYLAKKGMPFREAHAVVGRLVLEAIQQQTNLAGLSLSNFKDASVRFEADIYDAIAIPRVVNARDSRGGTGRSAVEQQLSIAKEILAGEGVTVDSEGTV